MKFILSLLIAFAFISCRNQNDYSGYWIKSDNSEFFRIEDTIAIRYFYNRNNDTRYHVLMDTFYLDKEENSFKTEKGRSWGTLRDIKRIHKDTLKYQFKETPDVWWDGSKYPNKRGYYYRTDQITFLRTLARRFEDGLD